MPESPESPVPVLRVDTDLIFADGSTKLMLTNQRPLICVIVQDAIENLRASLLFQNAFPDANVAFTLTRDALGVAAENHKPGGAIVQWRLQADNEYMARLVSLVCFMTLKTTSLMSIDSHVHGYSIFVLKSRSAATQLA